jgi:hypothetical protein
MFPIISAPRAKAYNFTIFKLIIKDQIYPVYTNINTFTKISLIIHYCIILRGAGFCAMIDVLSIVIDVNCTEFHMQYSDIIIVGLGPIAENKPCFDLLKKTYQDYFYTKAHENCEQFIVEFCRAWEIHQVPKNIYVCLRSHILI